MAFWGIEVKPGKPFTHFFDSLKGRLRISQATLGIGSATKRSLVQCNAGKKSPVLLCSLLPEKTESCSLDLEFEEADEVMFSVIGPRSVHLTGYYLHNGGHSNLNDDTMKRDSYGEDIGLSESEESDCQSEEDEYEDSFIDDGDPEAYEVASEDTSVDIKPKNRKGCKRLKKKYQMNEADNDDNLRRQKVVNRRNCSIILESEDEDCLPISSRHETDNTAQTRKLGEGENDDKKTIDQGKEKEGNENFVTETDIKAKAVAVDGEPKRQSGLPIDSLKPSTEVAGPEIDTKPKKKRKERSKEKKSLEDCTLHDTNVLEDKTTKDEASNGMGSNPPLKDQQNQAARDKADDLPHTCSLPSIEISLHNDATPKKKRRKKSEEEKTLKVDNVLFSDVPKEDKGQQEGVKADNICLDQSVRNEPDAMPANDKTLINGGNHFAGEKPSEANKIKKKRSKTQENDENVNTNVPPLSTNEMNKSIMDMEGENSYAKSSQVGSGTLSNGLIVEELQRGKPDGKVASRGKKLSVRYLGKLKENGHAFDSNIDGDPFNFRLGTGIVIEGWDIGIDGMRVGDKRRLTIPPSMGYGSEGDNENVPPNSWLVYDIELIGVR